jgi:dihydrofolate synthase/folylpolyglutamate synthase
MSGAAPLFEKLDALVARVPRGMLLGLDRVEAALAALGDPHLELTAVHIAGSNGKGSTAAMVESIARAAGLRTGLYTSPHLCRFAERIRLDGEPLDDAAFERCLGAVLDRCQPDLTFFESLTVAGFVAFAEAGVDLAVLEVGLGGRLDATNVIRDPLATAITSISLEHTAILGDTLGAIAGEKAGILKAGAPVVLGPLPAEADSTIAEVVARVGTGPILRVRPWSDAPAAGFIDVESDGHAVRLRTLEGQTRTLRLGLEGQHQGANAAIAWGLAGHVAARFPGRAWEAAIAEGLAGTRWPGRLERLDQGGVTVLLDAAHNPEGVGALCRALPREPARTALVFGALADKRWGEMLGALAPLAGRRYYTEPKGRAPAPLAEMVALAQGEAIPTPREAVARAIAESAPGDTVLVTGSIYLIGEVRAALLGIAADPVIAL